MPKKQVLKSGVTQEFVSDMKKQELFRIRIGTKVLHDRLTQDEYLDKIQTVAEDFYEGNLPNGTTITTEIISDN